MSACMHACERSCHSFNLRSLLTPLSALTHIHQYLFPLPLPPDPYPSSPPWPQVALKVSWAEPEQLEPNWVELVNANLRARWAGGWVGQGWWSVMYLPVSSCNLMW